MNEVVLFVAGAALGVYAVVIGGGMFLSLPLFQVLYPQATIGQLVGCIRVGSVARGIASTWATWKQIDLKASLIVALPFILGAALGVLAIARADQRWALPIIIVAILVSETAPKLSRLLGPRTHLAASFLAGVYGGLIGAGQGVLLVALLRLQAPEEERIIEVKIQARFVEFVMGIAAIIVHFLAGNLVASVWLPWAAGNVIGGLAGGTLLKRLVHVSGAWQRMLLLAAYAFALIGAVFQLANS